LSTVISWLAWDHEPSKQEMQMCSPATRHLWHCKSQLKFENDVLYYVWEDNMKSRSLLVAPDSLKPEILRLCHDIRSFGHLRHDKTLTKLRKMAFWYGMATQCKLYVASCHVYAINRRNHVERQKLIWVNIIQESHMNEFMSIFWVRYR